MDSKLLSQIRPVLPLCDYLVTFPRNSKQFSPKAIGFCTSVAGRSIVSSSGSRVSFSRVSCSSFGYNFGHIVALPMKRDFFVKAESNSEAEVEVEIEEASVSVVEENSEPEDAKPLRKPRVKLGDVMGEVPENRRRLSIYKGIVISRQNAGIHTTIRIRRIIAGVGVEIVFPLSVDPK